MCEIQCIISTYCDTDTDEKRTQPTTKNIIIHGSECMINLTTTLIYNIILLILSQRINIIKKGKQRLECVM